MSSNTPEKYLVIDSIKNQKEKHLNTLNSLNSA